MDGFRAFLRNELRTRPKGVGMLAGLRALLRNEIRTRPAGRSACG
jgi:hypothetical protein